ncbi:Mu transposase C-terminal domain-containing protein [Kordiimonas sp. A6E486]|nr:Mu transposase C-terminal domain-containing protein [Kordiimonas marina]
MPGTDRAVRAMAEREGWVHRKDLKSRPLARRRCGRGGGLEYHYSLLPDVVQPHIVKDLTRATKTEEKPTKSHAEAWGYFERLPSHRKDKAREKLRIVQTVNTLHLRGGMNKDDAIAQVAGLEGISKPTIYNWFRAVDGLDECNWLPHLVDRRGGGKKSADCHPQAWSALKADYLRLSKPRFADSYGRIKELADANEWAMPAERTMFRRMKQEIPAPVMILMREGEEALKRAYPPQRRDRSMFHALEAINADGHKWDVFVKWPDGTIGRPMMVAIQDLYSNKVLSWRFDRSENADVVRLAFADVFRKYGIPDHAWLDNGRGFASKYITGGTTSRFRFKIRPEDPTGILTAMGIQIHWTTPYSGQSKPIERAFRDLCNAIAKHPAFQGAYTGNNPMAKPEDYGQKAVPFDEFVRIVDQGIMRHNARPKRRTPVCAGIKSYDQAFSDSYADSLIKQASADQLRDCLLAADVVKTDKRSGLIELLGNRYHSDCLLEHIGRPVTVRFDPDNLHDGIHVFRQDGSYIGGAECIDDTGFNDTQAARTHARKRREMIKSTKRAAELEQDMALDELVRMLPDYEEPAAPETKTVRLVQVGNTITKQSTTTEEAAESDLILGNLGAGLRVVPNDTL